MSHQRRAVLLAASIPLGLGVGSISPLGELGLLMVLAAFVWTARAVPGFAGGAVRGAIAGTLAGVFVLGFGFRLAMRVVAITDPIRTPEFSIEGTAFILVGIGVMFGTVAGAYLGGLRYLLRLGRASVAVVGTLVIVPLLFGDSEIRSELFELGLGAWVNIPMFFGVVFAYGWAQDVVSVRLDRRSATKRANSAVVEPAAVP